MMTVACETCNLDFSATGIHSHRAWHEKRAARPQHQYVVTFREPAVVTELVTASSAAEAIELVKRGKGERLGFEIDTTVEPTRYRAARDGGQ